MARVTAFAKAAIEAMRSGEVTEAIAKLLRGKGYRFGDELLLLKLWAAVKSLEILLLLSCRLGLLLW